MSETVGVLKARHQGLTTRRFVLFVALVAMVLVCGLHPASSHEPELVADGPPAQSAGPQPYATAAVDQPSGQHHHAETEADSGTAPHSDHDAPVCHDAGGHDESTLTARGERPAVPDVVSAIGIAVGMVAAPRAPPWTVSAVQTTPARPAAGRDHLTLAQISRT
ncbi:hypothetical protein [Pseudonocardia alni]|uniref:Secreted protein n=1 Tax=Pseudonocardia alni subsp. carboxydivorans TaxID=415010 RepID=A0ABU9ALZ1_PSEA5|nr:hypothetical protein [Pseudonocardia alni]NWJ75124.1 hypothetical protein [Pseudonocardia pini]